MLASHTATTAPTAAHTELTKKGLYIALVIYSKKVLIIKLKRPKVQTIAGRLSIIKAGRNNAFTIPKIKLAIAITQKPFEPIPFRNIEASINPRKLASQVSKNLLITNYILPYFTDSK